MAQDFDELPVDDPIIGDRPRMLSSDWRGSLTTFWQTLVGYLSQWGIFNPHLTTVQRNSIQKPMEGQMAYNSDRKTIQIYLNGGWQEVTTTPAP